MAEYEYTILKGYKVYAGEAVGEPMTEVGEHGVMWLAAFTWVFRR
jgi:hypothetical protein